MRAKKMLMLFASVAILLAGCEKENDHYGGSGGNPQSSTTYDVYIHDLTVPSTMTIECLVIEYSNQNERLEVNRFNVYSQQSINKRYTANNNSSKVKVAFNAKSTTSSNSATLWVGKVYYLNNGGNTTVEVTGSSPTSSTEP